MIRIAIVGAGLAGLTAARILSGYSQVQLIIYEKSRGVGGRATTRCVDDVLIDHGAQVFQATTPALQSLLAPTAAQQIQVPVWTFDAAGSLQPGDPVANTEPRWCWSAGMRTLSKFLAEGLHIRFTTLVHHLAKIGSIYTLYNPLGELIGEVDVVLLTPPGPQTAAILRASAIDIGVGDDGDDIDFQRRLLTELSRSTYRRCLSIALAYPRRPEVPWYAAVNIDRKHPIAWLACEHAKTGHVPDDKGLMLAQLSHDFSVAHWATVEKGTYSTTATLPLPTTIQTVHKQVQTLLDKDLGPPLWADVQRWRYSLPSHHADFDVLNATGRTSKLYFAGDYVDSKGRIHQVMERGRQVAEMIAREQLH